MDQRCVLLDHMGTSNDLMAVKLDAEITTSAALPLPVAYYWDKDDLQPIYHTPEKQLTTWTSPSEPL